MVIGGIFSLVGILLIKPIFGTGITTIAEVIQNADSPESIPILKFLQIFNTLGLFLIPAFLFAVLFKSNPLSYLKLNRPIQVIAVFLVPLIFISYLPIINLSVEFNALLELPESLAFLENWMKDSEASAEKLTKAFLQMDSPLDLFYNVLLIGVLPAIGEELIFRGIVQQTLNEGRKNYHIGIWVSAILFSALHLQFYGFIPRMLLGALFGYLYHWSGSLWVPIFAHFINNATAVVLTYMLGESMMEEKIDQLGTTNDTIFASFIALVVFIYLMKYFKKRINTKPKTLT